MDKISGRNARIPGDVRNHREVHRLWDADPKGVDYDHGEGPEFAALRPVQGVFWIFAGLGHEDDVAAVDAMLSL